MTGVVLARKIEVPAGDFRENAGAGHDRCQQLHQYGETVALVRRHGLKAGVLREQERIRGRLTVFIHQPAVGDGLPLFLRHDDLECRYLAECHIEENAPSAAKRCGKGEGIGTDGLASAAGRCNDRIGVAHGESQHSGFRREIGVIARRAEVTASTNAHIGDAAGFRFFDGEAHGHAASHHAERFVSVDHGERRTLPLDGGYSRRVKTAGVDFLYVPPQILRTVGQHAEGVGRDEHIGGGNGIRFAHTGVKQCVHGEGMEGFEFDFAHVCYPFFAFFRRICGYIHYT